MEVLPLILAYMTAERVCRLQYSKLNIKWQKPDLNTLSTPCIVLGFDICHSAASYALLITFFAAIVD